MSLSGRFLTRLIDRQIASEMGLSKSRMADRDNRKAVKHIHHALMIAWCDWAAGMLIGLMPLLCHLLLHFSAKSAPDWDDNWAPDLLFISITNSGLVALTVFTRMLAAHLSISSLTPKMRVIWGLTIVCFALASMLYGAAVTGMGNRWTSWTALLFVGFSAYCSLHFELAVAREHFLPKRVHGQLAPPGIA